MSYLTSDLQRTPVSDPPACGGSDVEDALPLGADDLHALVNPSLDPLFWPAERVGTPSAWWLHVPFAHWIVGATAPRVLVELGTHAGVSYAAFCEAVARGRLGTRCHAVDTWLGDPQAGEYGEEVFEEFRRYHDEHFQAFSTLLRCTFDEALDRIADGSVDLLHIDGLHSYEAVRHDFESWKPKLSNRAVVLFHDTNEREGGFGVWRLWGELRERYNGFEFLHGHGLGVLAASEQVPPAVAALCAVGGDAAVSVRERFFRLGERWLHDTRERLLGQDLARRVATASAEATARAEQLIAEVTARAEQLTAEATARAEQVTTEATARAEQVAATAARLGKAQGAIRAEAARRAAAARREASEAFARAERAEDKASKALARAERAKAEASRLRGELARATRERDSLLSSTAWRSTWPLRTIGRYTPARLRRIIRGGAKVAWWTLTLKLPSKLVERRRLRPDRLAVPAPPSAVGPDHPHLAQHDAKRQQNQASLPLATPAVRVPQSRAPRLVYISGEPDTPGHLYRVARPAAAAVQVGARTAWMRVEEIPARLPEIEAADILVIWRAPWDERLAAAVDTARRVGAKIVFDVDDLMVDPELARVDVIDGIRSQHLNEAGVRGHYQSIRATMVAADLCVAATEELASHMRRVRMPTVVLPNGFDEVALKVCRVAARRRAAEPGDGLIRIGYAGGSRTHQRDFAQCAEPVAAVLREHPECRLVLFRSANGSIPVLDIEEFPALEGLEDRIEWRNFVPVEQLPEEIARFDVNLIPLEVGNPFCEAKSELKFFEAALVDVPTVASPTGPFFRAIRHGETGFLAATSGEWKQTLGRLVGDAALRHRVASAARRDVLWSFGPERRAELMASILDLLHGGRRAARAFELGVLRRRFAPSAAPRIADHEVLFNAESLDFGPPDVTVVVPLYNYAGHIAEALESVLAQTLADLDLVVVDDRSTDDSVAIALEWARANSARFNRISVLRNRANSGLALTRNVGFDAAETPFVLPLDADNRLLPECAAACLRTARATGAAFAYPLIRQFGTAKGLMGELGYDPVRLGNVNYIDAMALVSKAAWVAAGGYEHVPGGWEDFDFWCRLAERGLRGERVPGGPHAEYRVHPASMIQAARNCPNTIRRMMDHLQKRHTWLTLIWPLPESSRTSEVLRAPPFGEPAADPDHRVARLLPLLRCPETGQRLAIAPGGDALITEDGSRRWPMVLGRPLLFPGMVTPVFNPDTHISNRLPASALALIRSTNGPVLHLSAGGTEERFEHVIEAETAVFRHTDLLADAHRLPFADGAFDAVLALNAFEHYRDPIRAAREIFRVLRPGGRILIRTAFLQPLHEAPWHFYNCTRYGLEVWFEGFATDALRVSDNFHPGHSLAWLASECEAALRGRISGGAADAFLAAPIRRLVSLWRSPEDTRGGDPVWDDLAALPQDSQEALAAGFEYLGHRPAD